MQIDGLNVAPLTHCKLQGRVPAAVTLSIVFTCESNTLLDWIKHRVVRAKEYRSKNNRINWLIVLASVDRK